jgi:hypothetical protein
MLSDADRTYAVSRAAVAAAISNAYHPASDRDVPNTMETWGEMMG